MYERDDRPEPDPDDWLEAQADAAWQALPAWRRAIERVPRVVVPAVDTPPPSELRRQTTVLTHFHRTDHLTTKENAMLDNNEELHIDVQHIIDHVNDALTTLNRLAPYIDGVAYEEDHDDMHRHLNTARHALRDLYRAVRIL